MKSLLLFTTLAVGQPPVTDAFEVVSPAADRPIGRLMRLTQDFQAELTTDAGRTIVADVVSLRRVGVPQPAFPRVPGLQTTTGDRVPGQLLGGDLQSLRFRPAVGMEVWTVPIPSVTLVWVTAPPAETPPDPDRLPWLGSNRKRDLLRLRNGDVTHGSVVGFTADGAAVRFKPDVGEERVVPVGSLGAVTFNPALASARRPKGEYAHVVLRDGTRLALTGATVDETTLRGKALFGQVVHLPLREVVAIDTVRGKATDLSALKPKVEQGGYLGVTWPWGPDRTVRGEPIRLHTPRGIETFDRGLGTHPRTVLTYELAGKYRRFDALVGLDPASGRAGRAVVRVLVDGREQSVAGLPDLVPGPAVAVRLDLPRAKHLTLVIDPGPTGDVQADVNWADARLVE